MRLYIYIEEREERTRTEEDRLHNRDSKRECANTRARERERHLLNSETRTHSVLVHERGAKRKRWRERERKKETEQYREQDRARESRRKQASETLTKRVPYTQRTGAWHERGTEGKRERQREEERRDYTAQRASESKWEQVQARQSEKDTYGVSPPHTAYWYMIETISQPKNPMITKKSATTISPITLLTDCPIVSDFPAANLAADAAFLFVV